MTEQGSAKEINKLNEDREGSKHCPESIRMYGWQKAGLTCCILLGLIWLGWSSYQALQHGPKDIVRRWVVSQYVLDGRNPYGVAVKVLEQEVGKSASRNLNRKPLFSIPVPRKNGEELGIMMEVGPPEAVYPPSVQLLLSGTIGLSSKKHLMVGWTAFCWLCVPLLAYLTYVWINSSVKSNTEEVRTRNAYIRWQGISSHWYLIILAGLLLWPPVHQAVHSAQFSIQIACFLLMGTLLMDRSPIWSGVFFSLAMIKPSMAIPFMILPLARKRWKTLTVVVCGHGLATCVVGDWVSENPIVLLHQWKTVTSYFTVGPYSLQTILNRFDMANNIWGLVITLSFLLCCTLWCWRNRAADVKSQFDFLCVVSVFWTYHGPYDLIILFFPLVRRVYLLYQCNQWERDSYMLAALMMGLIIIALGTWSVTYVGAEWPYQIVRWSCRGTIIALLFFTGIDIWKSREPDRPGIQVAVLR